MDSDVADRVIERLEAENSSLKRQLREYEDRWQSKVDELNYKLRLVSIQNKQLRNMIGGGFEWK